jgi:TPR repeat protein
MLEAILKLGVSTYIGGTALIIAAANPTSAAEELIDCRAADMTVPWPSPRIEVDRFSIDTPKGEGWCGMLGLYRSSVLFFKALDSGKLNTAEEAHAFEVVAWNVVPPATLDPEQGDLLEFTKAWLAAGAARRPLMSEESRLLINSQTPAVAAETDAEADTAYGLDCVRYHFVQTEKPSVERNGLLCVDPGTKTTLIQLEYSESNRPVETVPSVTDTLGPLVEASFSSIWLFPPETEESKAGFRSAADRGLAQAQFSLGVASEVDKDYVEALDWYRRAAAQGHVGATNNVGVYYENGLGVKQDDAEAAKWYAIAAELGAAPSQYLLGMMYAQGRGVPADIDKAVALFQRAADQGLVDAMANIAVSYEAGHSVAKDPVHAYVWFKIVELRTSEGRMHEFAIDALKRLSTSISSAQVAEAERRAREWKPGTE